MCVRVREREREREREKEREEKGRAGHVYIIVSRLFMSDNL